MIYVLVPVMLVTGLLILGWIFPMQSREFAIVRKKLPVARVRMTQ